MSQQFADDCTLAIRLVDVFARGHGPVMRAREYVYEDITGKIIFNSTDEMMRAVRTANRCGCPIREVRVGMWSRVENVNTSV